MVYTGLVNQEESMDHDTGIIVLTDTVDLDEGMAGTDMVENTNQDMADTVESMGENTTMNNNKTLPAKRNMAFTDLVNSAESMDHDIEVMVVTDTVD